MPPGDCVGASVFTYNIFVYFVKRNLIFCIPILFVLLGYFKPKWSDMVRALATLVALMTLMHLVNLLLSAIGGYTVNYFYTRVPDNVVLKAFYNFLPIEYFYMYLLVVILIPIFFLYYAPFLKKDIDRIRAARAKEEATA